MVGMLHDTASGQIRGFRRWYALAHLARCQPCHRFLESLERMILNLRKTKESPDSDRLAHIWTSFQQAAPNEDPER